MGLNYKSTFIIIVLLFVLLVIIGGLYC
ncbi:YjcZ family sporulation protein [Filobacillus milosensis]|uniref:YjcZ family sporulation protein n=1 Tax=Filobacillus milosensis TaxID=94137 RepID=A0A4Y8IQZ6_9BACI|nr:YjcZ family sporulation protein [Filobacillus milosensis]